MAKTASIEPVSIVVGLGLGAACYLAVVYSWPIIEPFLPTFPVATE